MVMRLIFWLSVLGLAAMGAWDSPDIGSAILMILFVLVIFFPMGAWLELTCFEHKNKIDCTARRV